MTINCAAGLQQLKRLCCQAGKQHATQGLTSFADESCIIRLFYVMVANY